MTNPFFEQPVLNSPYEYPKRHWELDETGQPTQKIIEHRRPADFITPIPKPKKQKGTEKQTDTLSSGVSACHCPRAAGPCFRGGANR